ncbi:SusC/RagA family TonB-linked outer membrane protein [Alkalitalea saponilacus]|uniref:TonB-linked outer membrane protein, SusC/RagA family n=1 Tax=Alkalitalea saponilacus TaxID=889453 RepID=A0A1T5A951_9BACT|nr:SusC/RagA family TonB-linked outer membrane protein [Alkalitalea saponilacus]ASB48789.1 SusC/RagA family TonB-linked outer membrane protein [Alkalitalea saponilacus]SKB31468.1 TonB-linked outer membrane protein, SusC/RagA family [Alkalitalea saponilacus]
MKYIYIGLAICIVLAFSALNASAQVDLVETETLVNDTIEKKVEVAFRSVNEQDLLGGISVIDVEALTKKSYTLSSFSFIENVVGGVNGNIWGMNEMLVVIDGMVRDANNVLPTEIQQITVLKGAAAVVLYGSRASKGVVQITTKRGQLGEPSLNIRVNSGVRVPKAYPKYLGSAEYMTYYNEARMNDGLDPSFSAEQIYYHSTGDNPYRYPNLDMYSSDYLKRMYNQTEGIAEIFGGNERVKYYTTTGYLRESSILDVGNTSENYVSRMFARGNLDLNLHENFTVSTDANATFYDAHGARTNWWGGAANLRPNRVAPLIPLTYLEENDAPSWAQIDASRNVIDGRYFLGGTQLDPTNPVADAYAAGTDRFVSRQFQFNTRFDLDLKSVLEGLKFRSWYGIDYAMTYNKTYVNEYATFEPIWTNYDGPDRIASLNSYGVDRRSGTEQINNSAYRYTYNLGGLFDFSRTVNENHNWYGMVVANAWQRRMSGQYHMLTNVNLGIQASYNFDHKYYVDFSSALPYSAKLPSDNRLGFSPTVTLGWRPVKEDFFGTSFFDDLMLTVSGGIINQDMDIRTDENEMGYYLYKPIVERAGWYSWADLGGEAATRFNRGESPLMTFVQRKEINVGLRGSILNRAMTFDFNYFMGTMDGGITRPVSIYPIYFTQVGYPSGSLIPYVNYNIDDRSGFDFSMYFNQEVSGVDLTLGVSGMYSTTEASRRDENLSEENMHLSRIGYHVNGLWGLESLGLFRDQDEIDAAPVQAFGETVRPGDIRYKDQNGDGVIDNNDQVFLGRWDTPFRLGVNFTAKWRNFTLFAMANGYFGGHGLKNNSYYWVRGENKYSDIVRDRWTEETKDTATYPRLTTTDGANNFRASDYWLFKTDRINLSQVQLTYDIPETALEGSFVKGLSVYVGGYDLLTISKERKHFEMNVGSAPQTRFYNIGVKGFF